MLMRLRVFDNLDILLEKTKTRVVYLYPVNGSPYYAQYLGADEYGFRFKIGDGTRQKTVNGNPIQEQKYATFYVNPNTIHRWRPATEKLELEG